MGSQDQVEGSKGDGSMREREVAIKSIGVNSILQTKHNWLVVSTHLKILVKSFPQVPVGLKIKNVWNHHPDNN